MRYFIFLSFFLVSLQLNAQELNCTVQVVAPQVQISDKRIFETLRKALFEFVNNKRWTDDVFKVEERIECSMFINITEQVSADEFKGTIQIQARRPIYKTSYNSVLLNHNDQDLQFKYLENSQLEFSENSNLSNLTSVIAFYAYMIIGLDYDSYSLKGGETYLQKANAIVSNSGNAPERGWKAFESTKNRYWFAENMLNPRFEPIRQALYKYHRLGLDPMTADNEAGRTAIYESIELVKKVQADQPGSFLLQIFFNAKSDELVNIFSEGQPEQKNKVSAMLNEIDPSNGSKYQKITATK